MAELILIRGIPGSGKSTLARELQKHFAGEYGNVQYTSHFEADMFFVDKQGKYNFDVTKLNQAHNWCLEQTRAGLEHGDTVIVSNTFTTKKELKPYFELAMEFGIMPVVYLAQNQFTNVHSVPEEKLKAMRDRFQYDISELFAE